MKFSTKYFSLALACVGQAHVGCSPASDTNEGGPSLPSGDASSMLPNSLCSRDGRSILDSSDPSKVLRVCNPTEGCSNGDCVPACESELATQGSVGCEFYAREPGTKENYDSKEDNEGQCFAAFFSNNWGTAATLSGDYGGASVDFGRSALKVKQAPTGIAYEPFVGNLEPGEVGVVFFSENAAKRGAKDSAGNSTHAQCPDGVEPAVTSDISVGGNSSGGNGRSLAFRLSASVPISAYSIYPYGGAVSYVPSATLLFPTSAWKRESIVVNPMGPSHGSSLAPESIVGVPSAQVIAMADDTQVRVSGPGSIGANIDGLVPGTANTWTLQRGEVLQVVQNGELTGDVVSANRPIGVFGGHTCMDFPDGFYACDAASQQMLPLSALGSEYAAVPHFSRFAPGFREDAYYWRIVGAADGTELVYDPERPLGAPASLKRGEAVQFTTQSAFVVRSQDSSHPLGLFAYMTGCELISGAAQTGCPGDPEFVNVLPAGQFLDHYGFFVDPSFDESSLVVVRAAATSEASPGTFAPVQLDCAGAGGQPGEIGDWQPLDAAGRFQYTYVRLTKGKKPLSVGQGMCDAGGHTMSSTGPFTVTVWGIDEASSYAYPGGTALRTLNSTVVADIPR